MSKSYEERMEGREMARYGGDMDNEVQYQLKRDTEAKAKIQRGEAPRCCYLRTDDALCEEPVVQFVEYSRYPRYPACAYHLTEECLYYAMPHFLGEKFDSASEEMRAAIKEIAHAVASGMYHAMRAREDGVFDETLLAYANS